MARPRELCPWGCEASRLRVRMQRKHALSVRGVLVKAVNEQSRSAMRCAWPYSLVTRICYPLENGHLTPEQHGEPLLSGRRRPGATQIPGEFEFSGTVAHWPTVNNQSLLSNFPSNGPPLQLSSTRYEVDRIVHGTGGKTSALANLSCQKMIANALDWIQLMLPECPETPIHAVRNAEHLPGS
jgi:hypothetical protein